jgi:hypothetical protein
VQHTSDPGGLLGSLGAEIGQLGEFTRPAELSLHIVMELPPQRERFG